VLLVFERFLGKQSVYHRLPRLVRGGMTFVLVLFSWVLFRSNTIDGAIGYLGAMLGVGVPGPGALLLPAQLYTQGSLILMALGALIVAWPVQATTGRRPSPGRRP